MVGLTEFKKGSQLKMAKIDILETNPKNFFSALIPINKIIVDRMEYTMVSGAQILKYGVIGLKERPKADSSLAKQAIDTVKSLFSSGGRKFNGYGSFVQHIGDFGFRFDCVLTFGGSLQALKVKKIFEKMIQPNVYLKLYLPRLQINNAPIGMSNINNKKKRSDCFIVKALSDARFNDNSFNTGSCSINISFQEVQEPGENLGSKFQKVKAVYDSIASNFSDALVALEEFAMLMEAINTQIFEISKSMQDWSSSFDTLFDSIRNFGKSIKELQQTPKLMKANLDNIGNGFISALKSVTSSPNKTQKSPNNVQIINTIGKLNSFNSNYKTQKNVIFQGQSINTLSGVSIDIVNGQATMFMRYIGAMALFNVMPDMSYETEEEVNELISFLDSIYNGIFNENKFDGLNLSQSNVDVYTDSIRNSSIEDTINNLYFDAKKYLYELKRNNSFANTVTTNKNISLPNLIIQYYGVSVIDNYGDLLNKIIKYNKKLNLSLFSIIESGTEIILPQNV
jgi:hypothetical protein